MKVHNRQEMRERLLSYFNRPQTAMFCAVDAASFKNFDAAMAASVLTPRSLYLHEIDKQSLGSGPQLIEVKSADEIDRVLHMKADVPVGVWWIWPAASDAVAQIYRHLRTLNMCDVPGNRFDAAQRSATHRAVLFRHSDPHVLVSVMPLFDMSQVARVFGDAEAILVDAPDVAGVREFSRPAKMPEAPRGLLRIRDNAQYMQIAEAFTDMLRNRAVRELSPGSGVAYGDVRGRIEDAFDRADTYGMQTKDQIWEFINLDLRAGARFEDTGANAALKVVLTSDADSYAKLDAARAAAHPLEPALS